MSLTYFDDAEKDSVPTLFLEKDLTWQQVKKSIEKKVHEQLKIVIRCQAISKVAQQ